MAHPSPAQVYAAETLGTAILLATVVGSGIMAENLAGGNVAIALLGNTIPTGAILVVLITIFGPISGAHFNPAVSLAMGLTGRMPWARLVPFFACQIIGAIIGVWIAHAMFHLSIFQFSTKLRWGTGQWVAEAVATFGLLLTIFGGLRYNPSAIPVSVGLYITAAYWFTASTSFANPAVTIARALTDTFSGIVPVAVLPFIAAQIVGALAATYLCRWLFADEESQTARS
ncbi:MAG: MIP/aquaporin family protein [Aestuariivirga sp.]|nr:MIP/aquaporin family protein [Aestuariivirga sp.]